MPSTTSNIKVLLGRRDGKVREKVERIGEKEMSYGT
jgi:hypothetical protein